MYAEPLKPCMQEGSPAAAVHAYKTTIPPLVKDCQSSDGTFEAAAMGKRAHVLALNAVSRHLAAVQVTLCIRANRAEEASDALSVITKQVDPAVN